MKVGNKIVNSLDELIGCTCEIKANLYASKDGFHLVKNVTYMVSEVRTGIVCFFGTRGECNRFIIEQHNWSSKNKLRKRPFRITRVRIEYE